MEKKNLYTFIAQLQIATGGRYPDIGILSDMQKDENGTTFKVCFPAVLKDSEPDDTDSSYFQ